MSFPNPQQPFPSIVILCTNKFLSAPEPAGAVAPAPPTAAEAQPTATEAPKDTEAKPADTTAPAAPLDLPELPESKPAAGMSATSGPMFDEPNFHDKPATPAAPAEQPTAPAPAAEASTSAAEPTATATPTAPEDKAEK